jgi:UDP-N-acetylmuramoylalanine--D-glutamate ligase
MLVVGLGVTGVATARYLAERGVDVTVVDNRAVPPGLTELRSSHPDLNVILESEDPRCLEGVEQVILSPGLALDSPIALQATQLGIPVVGDIELFARAASAPVLAVTGSNGKSTVVTLLERMLSATGLDVAAGGNLGPPALQLLEETAELYLLEISSTIRWFARWRWITHERSRSRCARRPLMVTESWSIRANGGWLGNVSP